jgi:gamma-glutamyltranspeptidase/glutathione hydrolase
MTDPDDHELAVMAEQVTARGVRGIVCAAAPLAAQAGAAVMADGGNAFDAVVAAALAETVLLAPKCGLGGDLVAICRSAGAAEPEALLAVGGAPRGLADRVASHGLDEVGPASVGPPGAPAGYAALAARGRLGR